MENTKTSRSRLGRLWPRSIWARVGIVAGAVLLLLILTGVVLRFAAATDFGRGVITSLIDGRRAGPLGTIRLGGLAGDPLSSATATDLAFIDDNGAWMRASDIELSWSPFSLLSRRLDIERLNIETAHVFRRPVVAPSEPGGGGIPDFALRIGEASIDEIRIDDGVYGAQASYRFALSTDIARNRAGAIDLDLVPLNGRGDRLQADAEWTQRHLTGATVSAEGLPGGILASLIQSPAGEAVQLTVQADGDAQNLASAATLRFGQQAVSEFTATRDGDLTTATGYLQLNAWPLLSDLSERLGDRVDLNAEIETTDLRRAPLELAVSAPAGRATMSGEIDISNRDIRNPLALRFENVDLARQASTIRSGLISGEGEAQINGATDWTFTGPVTLTDLTTDTVAAQSIRGPATVSFENRSVTWEIEGAQAQAFSLSSLDSLSPMQLSVTTSGGYNLDQRSVTISDTSISGTPGGSTVSGSYDLATGALNLSGEATSAQLSAFSDFGGSASGDWSVQRASTGAPYRISFDGAGQNISATNPTLSQLLGQSPSVEATITWNDGSLTIENGAVASETVSLTIDGRTSASGALTGEIDGELLQPLDLPGARLESLQLDGTLSGTPGSPTANVQFSNGALGAGGMQLTDLSGRTIISTRDGLSINADLTGAADGQPLDASFNLTRDNEALAISDVSISAGALVLAAPSLTFEDGLPAGAFTLEGSLAGLANFSQGDVAAEGRLSSANGAPQVIVSGEATNVERPGVDLRRATFDAALQADTLSIETDFESRGNEGPRLSIDVEGSQTDSMWTGTVAIAGEGGAQPIAMTEPATWTYGPDGYTFNGRANLLAGALTADIRSTEAAQRVSVELAAIDLRALTRLVQLPPVEGAASGSILLEAPAGDMRTGALDLQIDGLNALGAESEAIDINLRGDLQGPSLSLVADGAGGAFGIDGQADLSTTGEGLVVAPDMSAPIEASLQLNGRAEQFWTLARQTNQSLAGALTVDITAAGRLGAPVLDGGFQLADGRYDHAESGFHLEDIQLEGVFDQRSLRLTTVSAIDGQGGRLSGDGQLSWANELSGNIDFEAQSLNALNRDDRSAVLTGTGAVSLEPEAILISGDMTIASARFSVEQPASEQIPTLSNVRRVNFPGREDTQTEQAEPGRPIRLDLSVDAPRRVFINGRGLDMEWSTDLDVTGSISNPVVNGEATLVRGDLSLAGRRFPFNSGTITLNGPIRSARINIAATGSADGAEARIRLTGTPVDPEFQLESSPALPQDEILSRLIFGRSAAELSALETAQLAAGLTQLAGGQAAFDPSSVLRDATGLDRISIGAEGDAASIAAGKYIAEDVFVQLGAGGEGGTAAEVEWEPTDSISVISSAQGNGDTRMTVRWKKDY